MNRTVRTVVQQTLFTVSLLNGRHTGLCVFTSLVLRPDAERRQIQDQCYELLGEKGPHCLGWTAVRGVWSHQTEAVTPEVTGSWGGGWLRPGWSSLRKKTVDTLFRGLWGGAPYTDSGSAALKMNWAAVNLWRQSPMRELAFSRTYRLILLSYNCSTSSIY